MSRARLTDEKKTADALVKAVTTFTWNPGSFAAMLAYEHPVAQAKVMATVMEVIDAFADLYIHGKFTVENADACELAYNIKQHLADFEEMRNGAEPVQHLE